MEEVLAEAVDRGRVTADDAQDMVQSLLDRARQETTDVVKDLEQLLERGRSEFDARRKRSETAAAKARKQVEQATSKARTRAVRGADPALAQVDRVRRAAGVGPSFPISGSTSSRPGRWWPVSRIWLPPSSARSVTTRSATPTASRS